MKIFEEAIKPFVVETKTYLRSLQDVKKCFDEISRAVSEYPISPKSHSLPNSYSNFSLLTLTSLATFLSSPVLFLRTGIS